MFKLAVVGTIAAFVQAQHPVSTHLVSDIKERTSLWTPVEPEENPFVFMTEQQLQNLLGTELTEPVGFAPVDVSNYQAPTSFDSRKAWPNCVHPIRNQASCGSCWAFGATEAFSDRICIATGGHTNVILSPQDLVSCDTRDHGCQGGNLGNAWNYLEGTGAATEDCEPYVSGHGSVPSCPSKCSNGATIRKYKCKSGSVQAARGVSQIQSLIQASGPVETGFTVYEDFFNYKSGIYHYTSGSVKGGHAVKIIGWGQENGTNYWICANSWGTGFGESGFFRIKFGEVGIDNAAYGCSPNVSAAFEELVENA
jgi:cathepsin B